MNTPADTLQCQRIVEHSLSFLPRGCRVLICDRGDHETQNFLLMTQLLTTAQQRYHWFELSCLDPSGLVGHPSTLSQALEAQGLSIQRISAQSLTSRLREGAVDWLICPAALGPVSGELVAAMGTADLAAAAKGQGVKVLALTWQPTTSAEPSAPALDQETLPAALIDVIVTDRGRLKFS